ncbi:MAG: hypothetical protein QE271_08415 [Bacteriovoracaceae bacterium]|nr:hypothetical protein [Bacteriovoracaceae bacterium]
MQKVVINIFVWVLIHFSHPANAIDEKDYAREINPGQGQSVRAKNPFVLRKSPPIAIDLDSNGESESIQWEQVDGLDVFTIKDHLEKVIWEQTVIPNGSNSYLGKFELKEIRPGFRLLIFYYFEGEGAVSFYKRVGRLFLLSFPTDDHLKKLPTLQWTPYVFAEHLLPLDSREKRDFFVDFIDVTGDGISEIVIKQGFLVRVLQWKETTNQWVVPPEQFFQNYRRF